MKLRLLNANIITESELEAVINRLFNEIYQCYRLRMIGQGTPETERKEQAAFLQVRVIEGLFPDSRHTCIRVKMSFSRWGKTTNQVTKGMKVIFDKDDEPD